MTMSKTALSILALLLTPSLSRGDQGNLYDQVAATLAARPDLADLGQPAPELRSMDWMVGDWDIEARVLVDPQAPAERGSAQTAWALDGTWLESRDRYPSGTQDLGFLTYDRVQRQWLSISLDSNGNSVRAVAATGDDWSDGKMEFLARDAMILGTRAFLRQTLTRVDPDHYVLLNEELHHGASWRALDEYHYRRKSTD